MEKCRKLRFFHFLIAHLGSRAGKKGAKRGKEHREENTVPTCPPPVFLCLASLQLSASRLIGSGANVL